MGRSRWYVYTIIFAIFLLIAFLTGSPTDDTSNVFYTYVMIGIWLCITIKIIKMVRTHRSFNSPQNNFFFFFGAFMPAYGYSIWGNFVPILNQNLLASVTPYIHVSPWLLMFVFPYQVYYLYLLYSCYRKFFLVYFRQSSVSAKNIAILSSLIIIIVEIINSLVFYVYFDAIDLPFDSVHPYPDYFRLIVSLMALVFLIRFGRSPTIPDVSAEVPTVPVTTRPASTTRSRSSSTTRGTRSTARSRSSPTRTRRKTKSKKVTTKRKSVKVSKPKSSKSRLNALRPKGAVLSKEDFKCIFCFQLPDVRKDKGRGIVLCPTCKHPAHADEFKDWLKNSNLCSRCDATLPASFRRNPKIISVETYLKAYNKFKREITD